MSESAFLALILTLSNDVNILDNKKIFKSNKTLSIYNILNNIINKGYIVSSDYLKSYYLSILKNIFPIYNFDMMTLINHYKLTKKFLIIKTINIDSKKNIQFNPFITPNLNVIDAIVASSCCLLFIGSHKLNDINYIDGGFFRLKLNSKSMQKLNINTNQTM